MKRMNSIPLSPAVFSYATLQGKPLPTSPAEHCSAKLVPRPFRVLQYFIFIFIIIDKGGNSLPEQVERSLKIRSSLKRVAFTKPNKHKKKSKSENLSDFYKVFSQIAFRNMIVPLPRYHTRLPARARAPLHLPRP